MNRSITISDCGFMPGGKSQSLDGGNFGLGPEHFEWELADPKNARFVTDSMIKHARGPGQVAWFSETFLLHPENYLKAMQMDFDFILCQNWYLVENLKHRNWLWVPKGGSWIDINHWGVQEKTREVSLILSEKKSMVGHRMRHEVAEKYGNLIDDVFGYDRNRVTKWDGLAKYKYSIVIQPERCDYYFNEALIDCLSVGTVPIYWGCPSIGEFFDERGMEQAGTVEDIGRILTDIREERIVPPEREILERNMIFAQQYRCAEDWIWNKYPFLFEVQA